MKSLAPSHDVAAMSRAGRRRAAGIFTARLGDDTTGVVDRREEIAQDNGDVRRFDPNEQRPTEGGPRPMKSKVNFDGCPRISPGFRLELS